MFLLNDQPLVIDTPFTTADGTQYPANWLRLASAEEKAAIGITEVADTQTYDDRFYWAVGVPKQLNDEFAFKEDGSPLMVQRYDAETKSMIDTDVQVVSKGLKSQMIAQVKATAASLLAPTDWKVVRQAEIGTPVDQATLSYRAAVRADSNFNEAAINACASVDELAAYQLVWPEVE